MYLTISLLILAVGMGLFCFFKWQEAARKAEDRDKQMIAFHEAGLKKDADIKMLQQERRAMDEKLMQEHESAEHYKEQAEKWKNAAETARGQAIREIQNLFAYNGTGVGQLDITEQ